MLELYLLLAGLVLASLGSYFLNQLINAKVQRDQKDWETRHRAERALLNEAQHEDTVY